MTAREIQKLDPRLALREGRFDPAALLTLWCARKAFFPLVWLGLGVAVIWFGDTETLNAEIADIDDPGSALGHLLSPLGILVLAFGVRLAANLLALAAAFPLTSWTRLHQYRFGWRFNRWFRSWWDRVYLARSYRSLRWTGVVRELAHERLGEAGRAFQIAQIVIFWAGIAFFIGFVVAIGTLEP